MVLLEIVSFEGFERLQSLTYPPPPPSPRFQQHFHLLIALHAFLARLHACVHQSRNWTIVQYVKSNLFLCYRP
jgi:hypothetical protein